MWSREVLLSSIATYIIIIFILLVAFFGPDAATFQQRFYF